VWAKSGIGQGFSSPVVANGAVFITGDVKGKLRVTALDLRGGEKWTADVGPAHKRSHPGSRSTCTIDGGLLYVISGSGRIACLNAANGRQVWTREMKKLGGRGAPNWGYAESVLIHKKLAIVTPGGSKPIVALDKKTGKTVWRSSGFRARAHYCSAIAVSYQGVSMIIQGTGDGIFGVNAKNGRLLWKNTWCRGNTANCPTPAFADGYVFWANGYGRGGICLKLSVRRGRVTAKKVWTTDQMVSHHGGYVIRDGHIYGNHSGGWACLDLRTGRRRWYGRGVGKGSLCYADGMLYLLGESGGTVGLAVASPKRFEMASRFSVRGRGRSWAHPVVANGRLYIRYGDALYCYDVKAK